MRQLSQYVVMILCWLFAATSHANEFSPVGYWKTIDDVSKKPKAIVEVFLDNQNMLQGRIMKVFYDASEKQITHCKACEGDKKNQPLVGMVIMEKLVQSPKDTHHWENGSILDPKTGKIYRCYVDLQSNNQFMKVRGYLGVSILGRTQKWERISEQNISDSREHIITMGNT